MEDEKVKEEPVKKEEFKIDGDKLVAKIKELVHEGNIRRVIIKSEDGKSLLEIPLTIGVAGAVLLVTSNASEGEPWLRVITGWSPR